MSYHISIPTERKESFEFASMLAATRASRNVMGINW